MEKTKILGEALAQNNGDLYKTVMSSGAHVLISDEPEEFGGKREGPSPIDFLCMSLASCKAITLRMYANRKGWKLYNIDVKVTFVRSTQMASGKNTFYCSISLTGDLEEAQLQRMLEISKACPVDRLLGKPSDIFTIIE